MIKFIKKIDWGTIAGWAALILTASLLSMCAYAESQIKIYWHDATIISVNRSENWAHTDYTTILVDNGDRAQLEYIWGNVRDKLRVYNIQQDPEYHISGH